MAWSSFVWRRCPGGPATTGGVHSRGAAVVFAAEAACTVAFLDVQLGAAGAGSWAEPISPVRTLVPGLADRTAGLDATADDPAGAQVLPQFMQKRELWQTIVISKVSEKTPAYALPISKIGEKTWLALVSLAYVVSVAILTPMNSQFGWDEAVYASQIGMHMPTPWAAARGRGMPLLDAPVTLLTSNATVLRVYLTILAGIALFVTLMIWRKLVSFRVTVIAGLLWSSLWIVENQTSINQANLWLAYSVVIATGLFLLYNRNSATAHPATVVGLAVASFAATMMHGPTDGVFLLIGLLVSLPLIHKPVRIKLFVAVLAGVTAGVLEWVIEAYMYFNGPFQRLAEMTGLRLFLNRPSHGPAAGAQGSAAGTGFSDLFGFSLPKLIDTLNGGHNSSPLALWWVALLLLLGVGVYYTVRYRNHELGVAGIVGLVILMQYAFLISTAYTRYFLPTFAVWVFVAAFGLDRLFNYHELSQLAVVSATAGIVLLGMAAQYNALTRIGRAQYFTARSSVQVARLIKMHSRSPCRVLGTRGTNPAPVGYYAGCKGSYADANTKYDDLARSANMAVLVGAGHPTPHQVTSWTHYTVRRGHYSIQIYTRSKS